MRKVALALLLMTCAGVQAKGTLSSLISYETVRTSPDSVTDGTDSIINITAEYVFPRSLSLYGGFSVNHTTNYASAINLGVRFYSFSPMFSLGPKYPVWGYMGFGSQVDGKSTLYPEAGLRFATSASTRLDLFARVYNSSDASIDEHTTLGLGFSF